MKILFLGSSEPHCCSSFYADAAEQLGHTVIRFNPQFFSPESVWERCITKITKSPTLKKVEETGTRIISLIKMHAIDCVLNISENFISTDTLEEICHLSSKPFLIYHSHDNNFAEGILKPDTFFDSLRLYDLVFTTKSQNVQRYNMLGQPRSHFIPSAFEPRIHRPVSFSEGQPSSTFFDISFIGTYDYSRDKYVNALDWSRLYIWGDRWKKFSDYKFHKEHIVPHAIYHPDFSDVMSRSKISLGLLREEAADRHTQRTFEIPACGAMQIAPRNDEILSYFEEDSEIVCFDSPEELNDKSHYYLRNEAQRKKIAQSGFEKVTLGKHSYLDRMSSILDKLRTL